MPPWGAPPLHIGGHNHRGPTSGQGGYIPPAAWGVPPLQSRGHKEKWPTSGQGGYIPPAAWGVPTASQRGGLNHRWPTSGQGGNITPAAWGVPTASERGAQAEVGHKWARWLDKPVPPRGSSALQSRGLNQTWATSGQGGYINPAAWGGGGHPLRAGERIREPTSGQGGYITPAALGVLTALKRGAESKVAYKWARWLHNPCRLGGPHRFRAGNVIRGGPQVGKVAT